MKEVWRVFRSAILAGVCIGIGGTVYMMVGGVAGAVLFAFGLMTVVLCKYKLYTGTVGFIDFRRGSDWRDLLVIILGNIVGCGLVALLTHFALPDVTAAAEGVLTKRLAKGALQCGALGIGCGFIMTVAVRFAREKQFLPLLFGIPVFILCGFTHSSADAFYYLAAPMSFVAANLGSVLLVYLAIVLGNLIGCNLYRFVLPDDPTLK